MVASTDIKFYVHTNNNAPQMQNTYGSMINVLDACLIDGIQVGVVNSLTASGNTVTATFGAAHNLMQYQVIKITGANQPEFNGEHRILTVPNAQSVTFEPASAPSVTTATGTIEASLPPLGWEKPFGNTGGKAAYRSKNLLLPSRPFLRVVDELDPAYTATYAKYAKVGIVEDMTDIDTMLGVQAPFDAVNPDKNWIGTGSSTAAINGWAKWYYAHSNTPDNSYGDTGAPASGARKYLIVGNRDVFYVMPSVTPTANALCYGFGAFNSTLGVDNAAVFLSATVSSGAVSSLPSMGSVTPLTGFSISRYLILQRPQSNQNFYATALCTTLRNTYGEHDSGYFNYINTAAALGFAPLFPVFLLETQISMSATAPNLFRGDLSLLYWLAQSAPYSDLQVYMNSDGVFIAKNVTTGNRSGQIILKVGEV